MMKIFDIRINDKVYTFVDSKHLDGKNYIAYEDNDATYISEYIINDDNEIELIAIDENTLNKVKELMGL